MIGPVFFQWLPIPPTTATCLWCAQAFRADTCACAYTIGTEVIGLVCPTCLAPAGQALLARAREWHLAGGGGR